METLYRRGRCNLCKWHLPLSDFGPGSIERGRKNNHIKRSYGTRKGTPICDFQTIDTGVPQKSGFRIDQLIF